MPRISDILSSIERYAPRSLQESYDNAGLQIGDTENEAKAALLCIDVTEETVDEAIAKGCNLIISHHPVLFKGTKCISNRDEQGRIIIKAIKNGITIYSAHTNMDNTYNGVSFKIAEKLEMTDVSVLSKQEGKFYKLNVFVPESHAELLRKAMAEAGAGQLGNYDSCSFSCHGEGRFRALDGANPFVGNKDEVHMEPEVCQEYLVEAYKKDRIINAMIAAHPYEEPAYDLIHLANESKYTGSGVVGFIPPTPVADFLKILKRKFNTGTIKYSKGNSDFIKKIAICGGSGAFLIPDAIACGADIYITGDVKYHDFTTFGSQIIIADIGHYESEQFTKDIFYKIIRENFPNFVLYYPEKDYNPINYL